MPARSAGRHPRSGSGRRSLPVQFAGPGPVQLGEMTSVRVRHLMNFVVGGPDEHRGVRRPDPGSGTPYVLRRPAGQLDGLLDAGWRFPLAESRRDRRTVTRLMMVRGRRPSGHSESAAMTSGLARLEDVDDPKLVSTTNDQVVLGHAPGRRVVAEVRTEVPHALRVPVRGIEQPEPVIDCRRCRRTSTSRSARLPKRSRRRRTPATSVRARSNRTPCAPAAPSSSYPRSMAGSRRPARARRATRRAAWPSGRSVPHRAAR